MENLELLYDHYKETFADIKGNIERRNRFFVILFCTMALQFLFAISSTSMSNLLVTVVRNSYNVDISNQMTIIQSLLWIVLLYITMRYYQSTVHIERQYTYIHMLEKSIEKKSHIKFGREGEHYLNEYPKINDMIDCIYKWVFPVVYCVVISHKIIVEIINVKSMGFSFALDFISFLLCFILTIFYLIFLHPRKKAKK